jgi:hypothetical protein
MDRKLSVGVLVAALLLSGLFVGVSYGGPAGVAASEAIVLHDGDVLAESGRQTKVQVLDEDGDAVGTMVWDCTTHAVSWTCTNVLSLKDGPYTERGSIVVSGIFRGFVGERLAVTGGTGAYQGAGGSVRLTVEGGEFTHTFTLGA